MRARKARCGLRIAGGRGGGTWSLTSLLSTRAPAAMRARTASARPCLAAWCSGVIPCPAPPRVSHGRAVTGRVVTEGCENGPEGQCDTRPRYAPRADGFISRCAHPPHPRTRSGSAARTRHPRGERFCGRRRHARQMARGRAGTRPPSRHTGPTARGPGLPGHGGLRKASRKSRRLSAPQAASRAAGGRPPGPRLGRCPGPAGPTLFPAPHGRLGYQAAARGRGEGAGKRAPRTHLLGRVRGPAPAPPPRRRRAAASCQGRGHSRAGEGGRAIGDDDISERYQ